uniref:Protein spire homolog 1-like n=1 Tax=Sinocyclocheilus grahami TaxID=75366 RepID=A0A672MQ54_SINGR
MARRRDEDDDDDGHKLIEEEEDARLFIDSEDEDDLSLDEILHLYKQPINEEQAWAVCYQCCRSSREDSAGTRGAEHVRIYKDGSVRLHSGDRSGDKSTYLDAIESLGIMIYKALDYGLKENEERELSPPLEQLIDLMTNVADAESDSCADEGYAATEEDEDDRERDPAHPCRIRGYRDITKLCALHLSTPADAPNHYQAVCRALYAETKELRSFLEKIQSTKENLRKMEGDAVDKPGRELNELQNADWAWLWVQMMRDLRNGVKLKKVQERQYNPLPIEFQLTPYEMLMDDIRSKRYKLRKVMCMILVTRSIKFTHVAARKLKPQAERPPSLHERILEEIKSERKLRPVSPDMIRRSRFGETLTHTHMSSSDGARKASSTLLLANGVSLQQKGSSGFQRKRLQAPTLAELDSSDSDTLGQRSASCSSISTSMVDDTSPESILNKKTPPMFLPISSTPQPERRQLTQRRHSIEKETPTSVRHFLPPSRHSSKSLVSEEEEFCFPVECLALTVEEVMHIRQVLVEAELEKFQQYKDIYNAMKKGKLCFCCRTKRFSFFTWSYTCQFCKRPVCSQCCKKMRLPSKPYASLPIYSLGPSTSTLKRDTAGHKPEKRSMSHHRPSLQRTMSRLSKHTRQSSSSQEETELPKELMEDWNTMEVCVDCKKFISDIIASSKHSLSLANKRARLKRKTQSFSMASEKGAEYRPSERTINEV